MAFQPVPDTVEIDIIYTLNSKRVQNVFYAFDSGGYLLADLQALADAVDTQVHGTWKSQQAIDAVYVRTEVRGLAFLNDITAEQNANAGPGVFAGATLPNNVTFAIKKTSGLTGRSARGRTYWIGLAQTMLLGSDENFVEAAWAADAVAAVESIRNTIRTTLDWEAVLVSRFFEGEARLAGVTFPWTGSSNVDLRVDTNRNRLPAG